MIYFKVVVGVADALALRFCHWWIRRRRVTFLYPERQAANVVGIKSARLLAMLDGCLQMHTDISHRHAEPSIRARIIYHSTHHPMCLTSFQSRNRQIYSNGCRVGISISLLAELDRGQRMLLKYLPRMRDTNDVMAINKWNLKNFVCQYRAQVSEAEERMIGEDGMNAKCLCMMHCFMCQGGKWLERKVSFRFWGSWSAECALSTQYSLNVREPPLFVLGEESSEQAE